MDILFMLFAPAITIATLGYISSIAVGHSLSQRHSYKIQPTRESYVLGFANLIGSVFQCFPAMGGFARSAINDESGARSGMASLISALLVAITLLFATSMFANVPRPVLSAVVVVAVASLINVKKGSFLWKFSKREFGIFLLPFTITVIFGIQLGIYASIVGAAILYFLDLYRLGSSINLVSEQRPESPKTLYVSIEGNLWYGNVDKLTTTLSDQLEQGNMIHLNMKDASLDSTVFELLKQHEKSDNIAVILPPGLEGIDSAEISDGKAVAK
jgi:SulP family sulfate permease